jgi:hypothetical protein
MTFGLSRSEPLSGSLPISESIRSLSVFRTFVRTCAKAPTRLSGCFMVSLLILPIIPLYYIVSIHDTGNLVSTTRPRRWDR